MSLFLITLRELVRCCLYVHNAEMRFRGDLPLLSLMFLVGCTEPASRYLGSGGPGETDHPAIETGGGKPASKPTPTQTGEPPQIACPPETLPSKTCQSTSSQATPPPLGIYLMLDRSGSMLDTTSGGVSKWQALTEAFQDFLQDPPLSSLSVAAQFFPTDNPLCESASYKQPAVNLAHVSSAKGPLISALLGVTPNGLTPTGPALTGAIAQTRNWAQQQPKMSFAIVLATDGLPAGCPPLLASDLQAIATDGNTPHGKIPAIPTFVVGILGVNDIGSGAHEVLDAIAEGGGTKKATRLSPSKDLAQQMAAALRSVANQRVACSFEIPTVVAKDVDLAKLNVVLEGSCGRIEIPYVNGSCSADGWRYDIDPQNGFPRSIELCSVSCERYRSGDKVSLEFGCATQGWPTN